MSDFKPRYLVMHDYGGTPSNRDGVFNPYHALVFPDGSVRYRNPADPYGVKAPHAYRLNPVSVGLSYAGAVGGKPTPQALEALKREYGAINKRWPGLTPLGHGEAFQQTRGTNLQASRDGRGLNEASWRTEVIPAAATTAASPTQQEAPMKMRDRAFTAEHPGIPKPVPAPRPEASGAIGARASGPWMPTQMGPLTNIIGAVNLPPRPLAEVAKPETVYKGPQSWLQSLYRSPGSIEASPPQLPTEAPPDLRPQGSLWTHRPELPNGFNHGIPHQEQTELAPPPQPLPPAGQQSAPAHPDVSPQSPQMMQQGMGAGWRDQPPMAAAANSAPTSQPLPAAQTAPASWVNDHYGQGIQWGDGSRNYMGGGGSFAAGTVTTDRQKLARALMGGR